MTTSHTDYRPDLDGLRAIAVLSVLFFHAGISAFAGGFVGVDMFFVLSGYFMAKIIWRDLEAGRFDFAQFYQRRMRRIFPALFAMIAATAVVASFLFMPKEFKYFADSVRAASLFGANIQFHDESGYFDLAAEMKPLLHTWSLSVEEQFYLVFPLALFLAFRFARERALLIVSVVLVASFLASVWQVDRDPQKAFYLLHFRLWELLVGAFVALAPQRDYRPAIRTALASVGLAAILIPVFVYDSSLPFPGANALAPCIGTALLIHASFQAGPVSALLGSRPMVFVGRISYSLYLWHWPVIVFTRYMTVGELTIGLKATIILVSFVLAFLSWKYIEQPFRFARPGASRRLVFGSSILCVALACAFGMAVNRFNGIPSRLPEDARKLYEATYDIGPFNSPNCFADSDGDGLTPEQIRSDKLCQLGSKDGTRPSFILWGDSHAAAIAPALDIAARELGLSGVFAGRASCPPLPGAAFAAEQGAVERCRTNLAAVVGLIRQEKFPLVFLAGYWPKYVHHSELPGQGIFFDPNVAPDLTDHSAPVIASLSAMIAQFSAQGTRTALIMDVPEVGYAVPEALARAEIAGKSLQIAPDLDYTRRRQALARNVLSNMARQTGSWLVDPMRQICDETHCKVTEGETVLYKDGDHLSEEGAKLLAPLFRETLSRLKAIQGIPAAEPVSGLLQDEGGIDRRGVGRG